MEVEVTGKTNGTKRKYTKSQSKSSKGYETEADTSFDELYAKYYLKTMRLCMRICPNWAEECHQEVWTSVYLKRETFKGNCAFASWLYIVTKNVALMKIRSEGKHSVVSLYEDLGEKTLKASFQHNPSFDESSAFTEFAKEQEDKHPFPDKQLERKRVVLKLLRKTELLPSHVKRIFCDITIKDKTHKEVSKQLKIPVTASKSAYFRARATIKNSLGAETMQAGMSL